MKKDEERKKEETVINGREGKEINRRWRKKDTVSEWGIEERRNRWRKKKREIAKVNGWGMEERERRNRRRKKKNMIDRGNGWGIGE